ncbi:MAG: hypothetical protein H7Z16_05580 [Pyrinomonadaceae bacterium]|nr:hypothetical protein [Pyrinomonadaceae bacterium]
MKSLRSSLRSRRCVLPLALFTLLGASIALVPLNARAALGLPANFLSAAAPAMAPLHDADAPTQITFEILNTACGGSTSYEFFLNTTTLGTVVADDRDGDGSGDSTCTCDPPLQIYTVSSAALLAAAWNGSGPNGLRFVSSGSGYFSWVRATIVSAHGSVTVYYDDGGGNATDAGLCSSGFTANPLDVQLGVTYYLDSDADGFGDASSSREH